MKWKWSRIEPGTYRSGEFLIKGAGTTWELYHASRLLKTMGSKKSCQEYAEGLEDKPTESEAAEELEVRAPTRRSSVSNVDSLESVIASFRLEVSRLTDMIGLLATKIDNLKTR